MASTVASQISDYILTQEYPTITHDVSQREEEVVAGNALPDRQDQPSKLKLDLLSLVNTAKFRGAMLKNVFGVLDFAAASTSPVARGAYFQTHQLSDIGVAKYPLLPDVSGVLPEKSYKALSLELKILTHEPLLRHDNIVKILSIQWTRLDPVLPSWMPILLLERADHGSLTHYLAAKKIGPDSKLQLSLEIGQGLQALHASGIVHGDVKLDNVLIFDLGNGEVRAKLSDFGCSLLMSADKNEVVIPTTGTPPWTAPELNRRVATDWLPNLDVYSYGLLVWRIFLGGISPFAGRNGEEVEERKFQDLMISDSSKSLEDEYEKYMLLRGNASSKDRFFVYQRTVSMPRNCLRHCLSLSIRERDLDRAVQSLSSDDYYG
jgi:serine/threonine protein kinase